MKEERKAQILALLREKQFVSVADIAKALYISLPTVRRDLSELENECVIVRCHGGATLPGDGNVAMPYFYRMTQNNREKRAFGEAAAHLVKDGEIIFIDESSSNAYLPQFLGDLKSVTVVTNGLFIADSLMKYSNIRTILTGGEPSDGGSGLSGNYAVDTVRNFYFDRVFFSVFAVRRDGVLSECSEWKAQLLKTLADHTDNMICVADGGKFDLTASYPTFRIAELHRLITDTLPPERYAIPREKIVII